MDPGCLIRTITTICVPLVFGLIVFVGIFGNALVIIVVTTNAQAGTIHKKRNGMKGWVGPKVCANCKPYYGKQDFFPIGHYRNGRSTLVPFCLPKIQFRANNSFLV